MEVIKEAVHLRAQGLTYKEISKELGVSVDWCKRNLKDVSKGKKEDPCMDELVALATRPQGIEDYIATGIIYKYHTNPSQNKVNYIKDKLKKTPNCIVHKGWIDHMKPIESHKSMNAFVLHLMDSVDLMVEEYTEMYPSTNKWSVRHEMLKLAFSDKIMGEPLGSRIARNELLAEMFADRSIN